MGFRDDYFFEATSCIKSICKNVRWKPKKDKYHLEKRKARGHLPEGTSLKEYNSLIRGLALNNENDVYIYKFGLNRYYIIKGKVENLEWIVIFSKDGIIETAFPPDDTELYIKKRGFHFIGKIGAILK